MAKAIEFDEDGATIFAAFADHPDELERVAALTDPGQVSKAIQRFAGRVLPALNASKPPADAGKDGGEGPRANRPPQAAMTRAKPVGTVLGGGRVAAEPDLEAMSQEEYEAYMNKRSRGW
jgi:hypothetical protein